MASFVRIPKFALVSHILPPSASGQAVVLHRLLRDLDPAQYCLISVQDYALIEAAGGPSQEMHKQVVTSRLAGNYYAMPDEIRFRVTPFNRILRDFAKSAITRLRTVRQSWRPAQAGPGLAESPVANAPSWLRRWKSRCESLVGWAEDLCNVRRQIAKRAGQIGRIIAAEKCAALVACSGDWIDLPAAWQAARHAEIPFYVYMFDDHATHSPERHRQAFARRIMPRMLRDAAGVIVPNPFLADVYRARYAIEPWIIPNPIEATERPPADLAPMRQPLRMVYTGAVYEAHYDAFERLLEAIRSMRDPTLEFHLYTPMCKTHLAKHHIHAPAVLHDAVSAAEANRLQRGADILFLPLAFDSPIPELVNTSAPGKMGELLASGRPILVHAPKDSFVSWYFRKHQCGIVVDEKDPAKLREAIEHLFAHPEACQEMVQRARARAEEDFALASAQQRFIDVLAKHRLPSQA